MNIVAIGGGEKSKALAYALDISGDEKPHVLLVPSSCSTAASFEKKTKLTNENFATLGASASLLHEFAESPSLTRIEHELGRASLIYTIGGNSPHMLRTLREHGTDKAIKEVIALGTVHAGTSAGALLPFELGHSNVSAQPEMEEWDFDYLSMLNIIPGVATVHAEKHDMTPTGMRADSRMDALINTFPKGTDRGYAIENNAALVVTDNETSVIRSHSGANVFMLNRSSDGIVTSQIL